MEFKCANCGNIFDDSLGVCPACGSAVSKPEETAAHVPTQGGSHENAYDPNASYQYVPNPEQNAQTPLNYQYQSYGCNFGQPPQQDYQQQSAYQNYPGYQPPNNAYCNNYPPAKSKLAAGLLGIFLGGLGIHNFYLGYTSKAVIQLLLSVLSCGCLAVVSAIWGFIEGILILTGSTITTDASGRPLGD